LLTDKFGVEERKIAKKENLLTALAVFRGLKDFSEDLDCAIFSGLIENRPHVDSSVCQYCSNVIYVLLDRVSGSQPSPRQLKQP